MVDRIFSVFIDLTRWDKIVGKVFITLFLLGISSFVAYVNYLFDFKVGVLLLTLPFGSVLLFLALKKPQFGFYAALVVGFFTNFLKRFLMLDAPIGVLVNLLMVLALLGLLLSELHQKKIDWSFFWSPITIGLFVIYTYTALMVLNPNAPGLSVWLENAFRAITFSLSLVIVSYSFLNSLRRVIFFTKFWLGLILLGGVYSLYQEFIGLPPWDLAYLRSSPKILALNFIGGRFRKMGVFGDVSEAGLFMAYASIVLLVFLALSKDKKWRIILSISSIITLLSMSFTGTRTAYAVLVIGLVFFMMVTIKNRTTMIAAIAFAFAFIFILYAPIYNPTIWRIRSTFSPAEDESFQVRAMKWERVQPWLRNHPIGAGIGSKGPLMEGEAADSGYVYEAIFMGWVGLILRLGLYFIIISYGIRNYYYSNKKLIRALYLAYLCGFFAMSIGQMSQEALGRWPSYIVIETSFVLMARLKYFEHKKRIQHA